MDRRPSSSGIIAIRFGLSQNKRLVTFTRYSVIDVLQTAPVFVLLLFRSLKSSSLGISTFNLKLSAINEMFLAKKRNNERSKYGRVTLTTCQYLRLLCAVTVSSKYESDRRPHEEDQT
jgi:hypothetical protein